MFDKIKFSTETSKSKLVSRNIDIEKIDRSKYSAESLIHSRFSISGTASGFDLPPLPNYARNHLNYLESFTIFDYDYASFTERENYDMFLFLYTYEGSGELYYHNKSYRLSTGNGAFIDCKDYHKYCALDTHWKTAIVHLNGPLMRDFFQLYEKWENVVFYEPLNGQIQLDLEELLLLYTDPIPNREWHVSAQISMFLSHLLVLSEKAHSTRTDLPENFKYLLHYLNKNYTKHFSLDDLASFSNMNKYYLSREFKRFTGFSPNDYLITLRINHAKLLLQTTSLPASKIAVEVGIPDQNNFTNLFRKKTGMTPTEYRKHFV